VETRVAGTPATAEPATLAGAATLAGTAALAGSVR
jgi:hypothetical protein